MSVELYLSQAGDLRPHFTIPAIARSTGHPDSIARALARVAGEAIEEDLSRGGDNESAVSLRGSVLIPGNAQFRFGGGRRHLPMRMLLIGTAPRCNELKKQEWLDLARRAGGQWIRGHLHDVDPERDIAFELITKDPGGVRTSSLTVARAPLAASQFLASEIVSMTSSAEFRRLFPEVGDDIEASMLATGNRLRASVTIAFLDAAVHSERSYFLRKCEIEQYLYERLRALPIEYDMIDIAINPDDREGSGEQGVLLTTLGTTADSRRIGRADATPEGEATSDNAEQFVKMILARVRGVRAAVVRLEEDDHGVIHRAFVRLELLAGSTLESVRPSIHELLPLRTRPARSNDHGFFSVGGI